MPSWSIEPQWQPLQTGSPEEQACFARIEIQAHGHSLTEGIDTISDKVLKAPHLSAYHLAEWLACNWWRLRWEPLRREHGRIPHEWLMAHSMASIGQGYIWPQLQFESEGSKMLLDVKQTPSRQKTAFRYICDAKSVVPVADFESVVDGFVKRVLARLAEKQVHDSALAEIWAAVVDERQDPEQTRYRKLEALLGEEPDAMPEAQLLELLQQASRIGQGALEELAADRRIGDAMPDIGALVDSVRSKGASVSTADRVHLSPPQGQEQADEPEAWILGREAARRLRAEVMQADDEVVSSKRLEQLYGAPDSLLSQAVSHDAGVAQYSLSLQTEAQEEKLLLRTRREDSRRFELARLLGDHLLFESADVLRSATPSATYRQKAQRAFAAEFLSPIGAVIELLEDDYSEENQRKVADHFLVSDRMITSSLVNYGYLGRSALSDYN